MSAFTGLLPSITIVSNDCLIQKADIRNISTLTLLILILNQIKKQQGSAMEETYVTEFMTKDVTTCSPDTAIKDVINILSRNHRSSLVIIENDEPVGIITERDLVAIMEDMLTDVVCDQLSIDHFMTSPTITIKSWITLKEAVKLSIDKNIRHLPVVNENNKLIGLLTQPNMLVGLS